MKFFRLIPMVAVAACVPVIARAETIDGIRAVVADRVITQAEVEDITRPALDTLRRQYAGQPEIFQQKISEALNDSLELLVERNLILHSFEVDGYRLPDSVIEQAVQDRIRDRFGDRVTLMKSLQQQGMTFEQFRKQVRDQYVESAMRNQNVQREVVVSPFKIQTYYSAHMGDYKVDDQVKLRMIVLNKTSDTDTNTIELAREIQSKLKEGASFTDMAAVYSQGSQQHEGGDWGWVERSVLRKELGDVAFKLAPGQVSDPIDAPDAVYVMLVEQRKDAHAKPLNDVRADIEKNLRAQQQAELQKNWIDGLKKKTFIRFLQ
ncbi:MAG: peptidyl-prolyl cis-trans isomerase [Verrucomicrobia bacterium]|nr:peptidyl-prolyl cis-trans isomerase [Verrucomicrobiota bacterium]